MGTNISIVESKHFSLLSSFATHMELTFSWSMMAERTIKIVVYDHSTTDMHTS